MDMAAVARSVEPFISPAITKVTVAVGAASMNLRQFRNQPNGITIKIGAMVWTTCSMIYLRRMNRVSVSSLEFGV